MTKQNKNSSKHCLLRNTKNYSSHGYCFFIELVPSSFVENKDIEFNKQRPGSPRYSHDDTIGEPGLETDLLASRSSTLKWQKRYVVF